MTEPGQTDNFSISDHINALEEHVGKGLFNYCICDTGEVTPEFVRKYNKMGAELVEQDFKNVSAKGINIIKKDMSIVKNGTIRHDPDALASSVIELICDDLRYKDKQNNTQYVMLNSKLKDQKKKEQLNKKIKNKAKRSIQKETKKHEPRFTRKSKFQEKYKERIKSIQNSEASIEKNRKRIENAEEQMQKDKFLHEELYSKKGKHKK